MPGAIFTEGRRSSKTFNSIEHEAEIPAVLVTNTVTEYKAGFNVASVSLPIERMALFDEEKEDDTIRPSLHPNRKRVKMTLLCDNGKITSAIAFKGEKEIVVDVGKATGDLKEAMLDLYYRSRTMKEEICND
jgi:hypothetical protein